ncbi:hypothetical protein AB0H03_08390 [Streptomyces sparsogenes]|uniref:hypothetical protein n=1 Tax=Streptomyces sparsogenes TaxID=67365 RepID=UPI0033DD0106
MPAGRHRDAQDDGLAPLHDDVATQIVGVASVTGVRPVAGPTETAVTDSRTEMPHEWRSAARGLSPVSISPVLKSASPFTLLSTEALMPIDAMDRA